jgi:hypothetical protein
LAGMAIVNIGLTGALGIFGTTSFTRLICGFVAAARDFTCLTGKLAANRLPLRPIAL